MVEMMWVKVLTHFVLTQFVLKKLTELSCSREVVYSEYCNFRKEGKVKEEVSYIIQ